MRTFYCFLPDANIGLDPDQGFDSGHTTYVAHRKEEYDCHESKSEQSVGVGFFCVVYLLGVYVVGMLSGWRVEGVGGGRWAIEARYGHGFKKNWLVYNGALSDSLISSAAVILLSKKIYFSKIV